MDTIRIKELKRKLYNRKENYKKDLHYIGTLFNINESTYLDKFEEISNKMVSCGIELEKLTTIMNDLDLEFEKVKRGLLLNENINFIGLN